MRRWTAIVLVLFAVTLTLCPKQSAAQEDSDGKRKITSKIVPEYPEMARRMSLKGVVKIEAVVTSNGTVKTVELKGGHPVLAQAAMNAVRKWKWEPASHDTREPIEVRFDPQ